MQRTIHRGSFAVGPHRRITLCDFHVGNLSFGKSLENALANPAHYVFEQTGWLLHHLIYDLIYVGVVQRILHIVGL